jgi:hypothetical protein
MDRRDEVEDASDQPPGERRSDKLPPDSAA